MLTSLKLTNFGCHEDLTVNFTPGLNVFRASNEAGKSTVLKALAYALWGAHSLPTSLADTVTWGQPVSSLRVDLYFEVNGVEYHLKRSKSGAELVSDDLIVTGQTEATNYVSKLLGATAEVASSTLMASQKDIESALTEDTGSLITTLANLDLIPKTITAIQEKHPSGSTKILENQLACIVDLPPCEAPTELEKEVTELEREVSEAVEATKVAQLQFHSVNLKVKAATATIAKYEHNLKYRADLEHALKTTVVPVQPDAPESVTAAEAELTAAVNAKLLQDHYESFSAFDTSLCLPVAQKPDLAALKEARHEAIREGTKVHDSLMVFKYQKTTSGQCSFCGEDFSNVPAVVKANQERDKEIERLEIERERCRIATLELSVKVASAEELDRMDQHVRRLKSVKLDESFWPAKPTWAGVTTPTGADPAALSERVRRLREAHAAYAKKMAVHNKAVEYIAQLRKALAELVEIDVTEANAVLSQQTEASTAMSEAATKQTKLSSKLAVSKQLLAEQRHRYEFTAKTNAANAVQREQLNQDLLDMKVVNGLISKLRDCRPALTNKLWSVLVDAVSTTFSQMRGVPSLVTRGDGSGTFLVDGKSFKVFSGSTQDILALAMRQTLVKVFLPYVDFMILDEPAAGCDADRETALIAAVSRAGFNQVLIVTHSNLADGFASNLITLD